MTEPPAAAALLLPATETTGWALLVLLTVVMAHSKGERRTPPRGARPPSFATRSAIHPAPYGSFCSSVRMFCGMVFAWATIAVLACCRIWAFDSAEVAWA